MNISLLMPSPSGGSLSLARLLIPLLYHFCLTPSCFPIARLGFFPSPSQPLLLPCCLLLLFLVLSLWHLSTPPTLIFYPHFSPPHLHSFPDTSPPYFALWHLFTNYSPPTSFFFQPSSLSSLLYCFIPNSSLFFHHLTYSLSPPPSPGHYK